MPSILCWYDLRLKGVTPARPSLRPVSSSLRSVIQSWVGPLTNKMCFEVFSGTGQLSATFLDCGALGMSLVDKEFWVSAPTPNSQTISNGIRATNSNAFRICYQTETDFDVVMSDPPFIFEDAIFNSIKFLLFKLKPQTGLLILKTKSNSSLIGSNINYFGVRPFQMRAYTSFSLLVFWRLDGFKKFSSWLRRGGH
ncbi:16S rRNA m(2)G966-methyltransferase [Candidatus Tremblaya phenacola PAVE]|nr:16S rRNA m(2)G966-methyltransferase [Candidatus Tremblaya phenacola PAVE]